MQVRRTVLRPPAVAVTGPMHRRAHPCAALAVCLGLAWFQAATAAPSITPVVTATTSGSGNVDSPGGTIVVTCHITNPNNGSPTDVTPAGTAYFIGVSHKLSCAVLRRDKELKWRGFLSCQLWTQARRD